MAVDTERRLTYPAPSACIGITTGSRPVFWDPHTPIFKNKAGCTVITGGPGSGKTFLASTIATISAIMGKTTVVIDPKGDFIALSNLSDETGKQELWDLGRSSGTAGVLDPFSLSEDRSETLMLVLDLITLFKGSLTDQEKSALFPILQDLIEEPNPSLKILTDKLRGSNNSDARNLGTNLNMIRNLPLSKLCFAPSGRVSIEDKIKLNGGLTIITLVGVKFPDAGKEPANNEERLGVGIMYLITDYLKRLMSVETVNIKNERGEIEKITVAPKTIIIDEAHAVLSSSAGAQSAESIARLGRSKKTALVLITQNNSDFKDLSIKNTITTRFAFNTDAGDAKIIVKDMGFPDNQGFDEAITGLTTGWCFMQDYNKKHSKVKISNHNPKWNKAFETNPLAKMINRQKEES